MATTAQRLTLAMIASAVSQSETLCSRLFLVRSAGRGLADVVLASTIAEVIVSKLTGHAGLGLYLKAKTRWAKRRRGWKPRGE